MANPGRCLTNPGRSSAQPGRSSANPGRSLKQKEHCSPWHSSSSAAMLAHRVGEQHCSSLWLSIASAHAARPIVVFAWPILIVARSIRVERSANSCLGLPNPGRSSANPGRRSANCAKPTLCLKRAKVDRCAQHTRRMPSRVDWSVVNYLIEKTQAFILQRDHKLTNRCLHVPPRHANYKSNPTTNTHCRVPT